MADVLGSLTAQLKELQRYKAKFGELDGTTNGVTEKGKRRHTGVKMPKENGAGKKRASEDKGVVDKSQVTEKAGGKGHERVTSKGSSST